MRPRPLLTALLTAVALAGAALVPTAASADGGPGIGFDVSWPQCASRTSPQTATLPSGAEFGIVGINNGKPLTLNPCFGPQFAWAEQTTAQAPQLYVNTANPIAQGGHWGVDPTPRPCSSASPDPNADDLGCAYDYGYYAARDAVTDLDNAGLAVRPLTFWLDVETGNLWRSDAAGLVVNRAVLAGYVDGLRTRPDRVGGLGIYTNGYLWKVITGQAGGQPAAPGTDGLPLWYPVGSDGQAAALAHCGDGGTPNGGPVTLVQWVAPVSTLGRSFDHDQACVPLGPTITTVADKQPAGRQVGVTGTGAPGTTLTLSVSEALAPVAHPVATVRADQQGRWSSSFALGSNAMLTVTDAAAQSVSRTLFVQVGVAVSRVSGAGLTTGGACKTRLDGSTFPWVAGQQAFVRGGLDRQIGYANVRRKGTVGAWSATVTGACGTPLGVKVTVAGVLRPSGQRFATDGRTPSVLLKPRRPRS